MAPTQTFGNTGVPDWGNVWTGLNYMNAIHDGSWHTCPTTPARFYQLWAYGGGHGAAAHMTNWACRSDAGMIRQLRSNAYNESAGVHWTAGGDDTGKGWQDGDTWIGAGAGTSFGIGFSADPAEAREWRVGTSGGANYGDTCLGTWEPANIAGSTANPSGVRNTWMGAYAKAFYCDIFVWRGGWVRAQPWIWRGGGYYKFIAYIDRSGWYPLNRSRYFDADGFGEPTAWFLRRGRWRPLRYWRERAVSSQYRGWEDDYVFALNRGHLPQWGHVYEERVRVSADGGLTFEPGLFRMDPSEIVTFGNFDHRPWVMASPELYFGDAPLYPYDVSRGIGGRRRGELTGSWTRPEPSHLEVGRAA